MPRLYLAMERSLAVLDDEGPADDWSLRRVDAFEGRRLECVAAAPGLAICGTFEAGAFRTRDGGATWERVGSDDLGPSAVTAVAASPHDPEECWLGTEPSRVYRSVDGGDRWVERPGLTGLPSAGGWSFPPRPATHHVRWLEPDPHDRDHLYVGIEAGAVVQTRDGGATWLDRRPRTPRDPHAMATHPDAPGLAWVAAGDGFAVTDDGGQTWDRPEGGLEHRYCLSVAPDPGDPSTLLLSAAAGPRAAHSPPGTSYVYRRRGDGPWRRLDERGLPVGEGVLRPVLAPGMGAGECFAASDRGVFRTTTAGDAWEPLPVAWPEAFLGTTVRGLAVGP